MSAFVPFGGPLRGVFFAFGLWWAAAGAAFFLDSLFRTLGAKRRGAFPTGGVFSACAHPFYAWWTFFAFPAAALLLDGAVFFLGSLLLLLLSRRRLEALDGRNAGTFGKPYADYRGRTNALVPIPRRVSPPAKAFLRLLLFGAAVGACTAVFFFRVIQPVMCSFGTTAAERSAAWPADEWAGKKPGGFTQAVTVNAPPEKVWPWLVQVGCRRAGWYNIDQINALAAEDYFFDGKGSSRRIVPELQGLQTGDTIFLAPGMGFSVAELEPNRKLLLLSGDGAAVAAVNSGAPMPPGYSAISWLFALSELDGGRTRVVSRFRSGGASAGFVGDLLWSVVGTVGGAILQQPAMLYGLAERAEGRISR